jgi:predicted N-acyltransferase
MLYAREGELTQRWSTELVAADPVLLGRDQSWRFDATALAPSRLLAAAGDRRWETRWVVARRDAEVVGVLPLYRPRSDAAPEPMFDIGAVAAMAGVAVSPRPSQWLYVGGFRDLVSGTATSATLNETERNEVRRALVSAAFAHGRQQSLSAVAMFVRDEEHGAFREALGQAAQSVAHRARAVIAIPDSLESFLSGLSKSIRYRVRKELAELTDRGLRAEEREVAEILPAAAALIAVAKRRYGVAEHPRLAQLRLREWAGHGSRQTRAFVIRDQNATLLGVSLVGVYADTVELYEAALDEDITDRHLRYTDLLVHSPLAYGLRLGCRRLDLGLDSLEPKVRRGARAEPVWAIAAVE